MDLVAGIRHNYYPYPKAGRELRAPGLSDEDLEIYKQIAKACSTTVWAWGSRTRGYFTEDSDYDVLIPKVHHSLAGRMRGICAEVSERLGVKIDLSMVGVTEMPDEWAVEVKP